MDNVETTEGNPMKVAMFIIAIAITLIIGAFFAIPYYNVWQQGMSGEAALARANQTRQIMVTQAQAERDAATLRAQAIGIMGKAAKEFPEYREQEFIGAFAEALKEGKINQLIYVPTENNIPVFRHTAVPAAKE